MVDIIKILPFSMDALVLGSISIHNTVLHTDIDEDEPSCKIQSQSPAKTSIAIKSHSAGLTEDSPQQKWQELFQTSFRSSTRLMRWKEAWRCNGVLMF